LILRSNLTALNTVAPGSDLPALLKDLRVVITASFPSTEVLEVESRRESESFNPASLLCGA